MDTGAGQLCIAQPVDDLDIFGMADDGQAADACGLLQQRIEVAIVGAVQAEVAPFLALEVHEIFERADTVVAHITGQLAQVQLRGGAEVKAIVHMRARFGVGLLARKHVGVGLVVEKVAEHGAETADGRMCRLSAVFGDLFAEAEVHMGVDQAGEDMQAVDAPRSAVLGHGSLGCQQGGDATVGEQDVHPLGFALGAHQRAAAQDQGWGHGVMNSSASWACSHSALACNSAGATPSLMQTKKPRPSAGAALAYFSGGMKWPCTAWMTHQTAEPPAPLTRSKPLQRSKRAPKWRCRCALHKA